MIRTSTCLLALLAGTAHAQFFTDPAITLSFDLSWQEDPGFAHNDNGILETGEHAIIRVSCSFTGQNTTAAFDPPIGLFTSGRIMGFAGAYVDLLANGPDPAGSYNGGITVPLGTSTGPNNNTSGTSGYGVRGGWRLGGNMANGIPTASGFEYIGPGQMPITPSNTNTTNPVAGLHRLGWAPASYVPRQAIFALRPNPTAGEGAVALILDLDGGTTCGAVFIPLSRIHFGTLAVPMGLLGPCWPNCDGSTTAPVLNVLDFGCFLNHYAAGDSYANCDGSTQPPVLNVLDFSCFLNRFAAGCF
jgi:hypothetical protein